MWWGYLGLILGTAVIPGLYVLVGIVECMP